MDAYRKHQLAYQAAHNKYDELPEDIQCEIDEKFFSSGYGEGESTRLDWENFLINELQEYK